MQGNKMIVQEFLRALGEGNVEAVKRLLATDAKAICTGISIVSGTRGGADICAATGLLRSLTKNGIDFHIVSMTAEDDRVSCEVEGRSILVNGMPYNNQYHFLFAIRDGRIYLLKEYIDTKLVDETLGPLLLSAMKS